jgi:hypothetical protein
MTRTALRVAVSLLAALLVLSSAPALGAQSSGDLDLDAMVDTYNANLDDAPGIARGELAGKSIELRAGSGSTMATASSGTAYHFTTDEDGVVTDFGEGDATDADVRVRTSEDTMNRILESDDPAAAFDTAYENGEIEISGLTLTDSLRIELVKFAVWLGKLFGFL